MDTLAICSGVILLFLFIVDAVTTPKLEGGCHNGKDHIWFEDKNAKAKLIGISRILIKKIYICKKCGKQQWTAC